jgi:flagellar basal-body rod protein FlgB
VRLLGNLLNNVSIDLIEKKLDAVWMRQQVISNNIANAGTPNYKSKSVEFESILERKLSASGGNESAVRSALDSVEPKIVERDSTSTQEDGNNVDEVYESVEMARALLEYSYLTSSLTSTINRMKYVVTEGKS